MKTAVLPSALTVSDRGRAVWAIASSRQCGGGGTSLRSGTGMPARSSLPIQMRSSGSGSGTRRSLLDPGERLRHQGSDRGQVVAALLHEDGRKSQAAEDAPGLAVAGVGDVERALGIARRGVDAEGDDERLGAAVLRPARQAFDRVEPLAVAHAGGERHVAVRAGAVGGAGLVREAEEVGEPAGARVDVDGAGEDVGALVEDRLRAVAVVGVDVD